MGIFLIGDIWDALTGAFGNVAGWAIDSVFTALTSWVIAGVLAVIEAMWSVIDTSTQPQVAASWFSGDATSPFQLALTLGGTTLSITLLLAIIRGVLSGSPGALGRVIGRDLPSAILAMVLTIAVTKIGLDLSESMSNWVWAGTRDDAKKALDNLAIVMRTGLPGTYFLGIVLSLALMWSLAFLWLVLFIRQALLYIVIVFSVAFAWPTMVFPPMRDTAKKSLELLVALIVAKPVITLALSVGVSALGGIGDTGQPGAGVGVNLARELGTLVSGVAIFAIASFMPFLVWKLMPLVGAAVVAQGIASAPMRAVQTAMQLQYYASSSMTRLASGGKTPGKDASGNSTPPSSTSSAPDSAASTSRLAGTTR